MKTTGRSAAWFSAFDWGSKGREFKSLRPDHSFTIRHLGLYPSAFLFAILRVFFEVKPPEKPYCRIHRVNPAAPKFPFFRFIHSVFQSPGTLSTAPLQPTLDIASYAYSSPIRVTAIHSKSLARSLQTLLRAVYEFTFVLEPKVFCQPKVQVVSINLPEIDMESGFYGVRCFAFTASLIPKNDGALP